MTVRVRAGVIANLRDEIAFQRVDEDHRPKPHPETAMAVHDSITCIVRLDRFIERSTTFNSWSSFCHGHIRATRSTQVGLS